MGLQKLLDSQSALAATTTVDRDEESHGGHIAATFFLDISAITGTWTCAVQLNLNGAVVTVATAQHTTTGLKILTMDAAFTGDSECIPTVNRIVWTEDVSGAITADVIAVYG